MPADNVFLCVSKVVQKIMYLTETIVNPVHNAQVCYFNNVWFMCLVFKKNFYLFKQPLVPPSPPPPRSFAFPTPVLYPVDPPSPRLVLRISHSGSLTHRAPRPVLHISHSGSLTRRSPPPGPSHFPLQFFNLLVPILENPTGTKELLVPFMSTTLPS